MYILPSILFVVPSEFNFSSFFCFYFLYVSFVCYLSVLDNIEGGNSSAAKARVADFGSNVQFDRMYGGRMRWGFLR